MVQQKFAVKIPQGYPLECAGPIMCSGVTLYSPLKRFNAGPGTKVAVVGIGGLGQMGIRLAKAMGCVVTAISRSNRKEEFARSCGADHFLASSDSKQMLSAKGTLDLVLNTIPGTHDYDAYTKLLRPGGKHCFLGIHKDFGAALILDGICCDTTMKVSGIGNMQETQEVIDLCHEKKIQPEVKVMDVSKTNWIYEQLSDNDTGVRYVLDLQTLNAETNAKCTDPAPKLGHADPVSLCAFLCACCSMCWSCKY